MPRKTSETQTAAGEVIDFLQSDPHAREICGHNDSLASFCKTTGIPRGTLRSQIDNNEFKPNVRAALADNFDFDVSLLDEELKEFKRQFRERYRDAATRETAKRRVLEYRKSVPRLSPHTPRPLSVSRPRRLRPADDLLASLQLGVNQAGPDEPWPMTVELVCRFTRMDRVTVGVKRGKLSVNCGQARTTAVKDRLGGTDAYKPDGSDLTIVATGDDIEPVWLVESDNGPIGLLSIEDGICRLLDVGPGCIISANFQAYIKDLRSAEPDPATASRDSAGAEDGAYSFIQPGRKELETRAKNAILARMAASKLLGEGDWVVLCCDELVFQNAADPGDKT